MGACSSTHPTAFEKTVEVRGLKIAIVGDPEVGKTSLLARYIHNQFSHIYIPTRKAAIENVVRKLNVPGHATVPITFWDIPGKEDLPLHQSYFRDLDAVIVVVDLNDPSRIESGRLWRQTVLNTASFTEHSQAEGSESISEGEVKHENEVKSVENIPFLLLGNKHDLVHNPDKSNGLVECQTEIVKEEDKSNTGSVSLEKGETRTLPESVKLLEDVASDGFVGSVMVSAKANDLSVHAAIQSFLRHILEKLYVYRRWHIQEKTEKVKRPRYQLKPQMEHVGVAEIDAEFAKAEEIIHRVTSLHRYQDDSLNKFAEQCVDVGVIETSKDASMQNCLVALRDKLDSLDLKLKLNIVDEFCVLEVKASTEDAELEKSVRYAIKTFNKEYAAVTKAMLMEYPLAEAKLGHLEKTVDKLCQHYEVSPSTQGGDVVLITDASLQAKAQSVEKNRAMMRHTQHECHDCLAHIQRSLKQAKAAFVW